MLSKRVQFVPTGASAMTAAHVRMKPLAVGAWEQRQQQTQAVLK